MPNNISHCSWLMSNNKARDNMYNCLFALLSAHITLYRVVVMSLRIVAMSLCSVLRIVVMWLHNVTLHCHYVPLRIVAMSLRIVVMWLYIVGMSLHIVGMSLPTVSISLRIDERSCLYFCWPWHSTVRYKVLTVRMQYNQTLECRQIPF